MSADDHPNARAAFVLARHAAAEIAPRRHDGSRRLAWLLVTLCVSACSLTTPQRPAQPPPPVRAVRALPSGGVVAIQRPTPDWARLSLWLDAGSLDADPPALATVSARWAAASAGVESRVLPDATELYLDCDLKAQRLTRCLGRLTAALAPPSPADADAAGLIRGLVRDRRRQAADPWTEADRSAMVALFGDAAAALDPMGSEKDDTRLKASGIRDFLRDHYGPNRALLVGAGDLAGADLENWATGLVPAQRSRAQRGALTPTQGVRVFVGQRRALALIMQTPSVEAAARLGRAFQVPHPDANARAFSIGPSAFLLLQVPVEGAPWATLRTATFDALRLSVEMTESAPVPPGADDLTSLTRRTGEAWVRGEDSPDLPSPWPLGVSLGLTTPEPVAPERDNKDAEAMAEWLARAQAAVEAARAQVQPRTSGASSADRASIHLPNGVRIQVERRPHDARFAALFEVEGGAALDAPGQHGRAALLATLSASACGYASAPALQQQLQSEGSHMRPLVLPRRWGVLSYGDAVHWREAVDRLLRCVLRPSFRGRDVEDARLRLFSDLHRNPAARFAWEAAQTLLPEAPGTLSSWGSPRGVAAVSGPALRRLHERSLRGGAVTLRLIVPADADNAARFVARRVAQLPDGNGPGLPEVHPRALELRGARTEDSDAVHVWVGVSSEGREGAGAAVLAAAQQVAHRLHALAGYEAVGVAGDSGLVSWLWIELLVHDPALLDSVPSAIEHAMVAVRRSLPDAITPALAAARKREAMSGSDPVQALRQQFAGAPDDDERRQLAHVRTLLETRPSYVVMHPTRR